MSSSVAGSSPRGNKRRRTSESPGRERGRRRSVINSQSRLATEGTNGLVGSSRDLERESEGSEPSTEEDEDEQPRRTRAREGVFGMSLPGDEGDEEEEGEPDTETSGSDQEEENGAARVAIQPPFASRPSTSSNGARLSAPRISPAVLDLTDDGDDDDDPEVEITSRPSPLPKLETNSSDDVLILPSTSSSHPQPKGKSLSVPTPSPSPSTQPPPSAETISTGPSLPSLATLSCPICLGPPTPLALTACGHAFCAPCLHAALVAGPALTPPPPENAGRGRGTRGGTRARARARGRGRGRAAAATTRGRGRGSWQQRGGFISSDDGVGEEEEDQEDISDGDPELNKHCPVCRTPLYGGWGKSLRGLVIRMAPVKQN
ncbi:hypothetical protein JCM3765_003567 [Sporobolomyces pararoseus]